MKGSKHESDLSSEMEPKVVSRKARGPEEVVWLSIGGGAADSVLPVS